MFFVQNKQEKPASREKPDWFLLIGAAALPLSYACFIGYAIPYLIKLKIFAIFNFAYLIILSICNLVLWLYLRNSLGSFNHTNQKAKIAMGFIGGLAHGFSILYTYLGVCLGLLGLFFLLVASAALSDNSGMTIFAGLFIAMGLLSWLLISSSSALIKLSTGYINDLLIDLGRIIALLLFFLSIFAFKLF